MKKEKRLRQNFEGYKAHETEKRKTYVDRKLGEAGHHKNFTVLPKILLAEGHAKIFTVAPTH